MSNQDTAFVISDDKSCMLYEFIIDEEGGRNMYKALVDKDIRSLEIDSCNIDNEGFKHIIALLEENTCIKNLHLKRGSYKYVNMYKNLQVEELFQKKIHITWAKLDIDNTVSHTGRILNSIANNPDLALEYLDIDIGEIWSGEDREVVQRGLDICADSICLFFANNKTIKEFYISLIVPYKKLINAIADGLSIDGTVKTFTLVIGNYSLVLDEIDRLACVLKTNKTMNSLTLNLDAYCGKYDVNKMFIECMRENTSLNCLKIKGKDDSYNKIELSDELMAMVVANAPMTKSARKRE